MILGSGQAMKWLVKTLAGAVIGGLGWKLGADAYEALKKRMGRKQEPNKDEERSAEEGAAASHTDVVDVSEDRPEPGATGRPTAATE